MSAGRGLVPDANILIRAALGKRVRFLLETYEDSVGFYAADVDQALYLGFEQLARERMAA